MVTIDEQAILNYANGRLLANCREFRQVFKDGMFNIGWLARVINLGQVQVLEPRLTPEMVTAAVADVVPLNQSDEIGAFAELTLEAPCLGYMRPDRSIVLIDGLKRARQRFAAGRPDMPIKVIKLDDARKFGMSAEYREHWKILEATENHPIGAVHKRNYDKVIVELWDDREAEAPGRGQPRFSEQQSALAHSMTYYLVSLIELEFYIYENHPGSSLIGEIERDLHRRAWTEEFLLALYRTGRIPVALSSSEVANLAGAAIAFMTPFRNRPDFKRHMKGIWVGKSPEALAQDRENTLEICIAVMKADLRFGLRQNSTRTLVGWENDPAKVVKWRNVHSAVEGWDDRQRRHELSKLDFSDQLMVTHITGVNMSEVYHDHTNRFSLFQAYAFLFDVERNKRAIVDPCMVETIVHRRALEILDQRDGLTDSWGGLFEHWRHLGFSDAVLLGMTRQLDAYHAVRDGEEFTPP